MTKVKYIFFSIALLAIVSCNQQQQKDETTTNEKNEIERPQNYLNQLSHRSAPF